jgi:hypothetical protein
MHSIEALNESCRCISVDAAALKAALADGNPGLDQTILANQPHLFSQVPVFISPAHIEAMQEAIRALERVIALPAYRAAALEDAPSIARHDPKTQGVFFGFDFHMADGGPKLIEINTNAGGAFLNLALGKAQRACCEEMHALVQPAADSPEIAPEIALVRMFERELALLRPGRPLTRVAIVDADPQAQYLYPEFLLAAALFRARGVRCEIADPKELRFDAGTLTLRGEPLDLVYNRSTDFYFAGEDMAALRAAYLADAVAVTPHPHAHALYANKANLVRLSDPEWLAAIGVDAATRSALMAAVPRTVRVYKDDRDKLWAERKALFFKPEHGFGSRAAYRGDKLTKATFEAILDGAYVAQALVPPSTRTIVVEGEERPLKLDVRAYVYDGAVQLYAARLYQGQTTNFRTVGGGFAPVFTRAPTAGSAAPTRDSAAPPG